MMKIKILCLEVEERWCHRIYLRLNGFQSLSNVLSKAYGNNQMDPAYTTYGPHAARKKLCGSPPYDWKKCYGSNKIIFRLIVRATILCILRLVLIFKNTILEENKYVRIFK